MTDADNLPDIGVAAERVDGLIRAGDRGRLRHEPNIVHATWTRQVHKSLMARKSRLADISGMSENALTPESREAIGHRLRLTREALGLSLTEFATKAGMSKTRYENFEAGRNLIKPDLVAQIIRAFPAAKLDFNWVYHGDMNGIAHDLAVRISETMGGKRVA
ncbi:helix-turn-helix transcriptional regulator [Methylobacterium sp. 1973]|uniref:helix-turn-helix domain-containing protein n=1 Tax=Methylobacterium sp. 1973 TaxID=3156421 RepID=UPI003391C9D4